MVLAKVVRKHIDWLLLCHKSTKYDDILREVFSFHNTRETAIDESAPLCESVYEKCDKKL